MLTSYLYLALAPLWAATFIYMHRHGAHPLLLFASCAIFFTSLMENAFVTVLFHRVSPLPMEVYTAFIFMADFFFYPVYLLGVAVGFGLSAPRLRNRLVGWLASWALAIVALFSGVTLLAGFIRNNQLASVPTIFYLTLTFEPLMPELTQALKLNALIALASLATVLVVYSPPPRQLMA